MSCPQNEDRGRIPNTIVRLKAMKDVGTQIKNDPRYERVDLSMDELPLEFDVMVSTGHAIT